MMFGCCRRYYTDDKGCCSLQRLGNVGVGVANVCHSLLSCSDVGVAEGLVGCLLV